MSATGSKYKNLCQEISGYGKVMVAYSGGVDSTLLLRVALECLGRDNVLAVTSQSPLTHELDITAARGTVGSLGAQHRIITVNNLENENIASNPPHRCYYCKLHLYTLLEQLARQEGYSVIIEGTNASDQGDYRPGFEALQQFNRVRSPLLSNGLDKSEVRQLAYQLGLENWDRPSNACLASRFPYGEPLTAEKLAAVSRAETELAAMGLTGIRVRYHGPVARIEMLPGDMERMMKPEMRAAASQTVKKCGFTYVSLDLDGYVQGSLNKELQRKPGGREFP